MRLGFIMPEYPCPSGHGGIATYTYIMAEALLSLGHDVTILVKSGTIPDAMKGSVKVKSISPAPIRGFYQRYLRFFLKEIAYERSFSMAARIMFDDIRIKEGLDLVEIPEYNGNALFFKSAPYKVVVRLHTPTYLVDRLNSINPSWRLKKWYGMEYDAIDHANGITSPSVALKNEVASEFRLNADSITVIRNPIDTSIFHPLEKKDSSYPLRLLFAGRLEKRKGLDVLVELAGRLFKEVKNIVLTFAGSESGKEGARYRQALSEAAGENRHRMEFLGSRPRSELPFIYRSSDIFVIPSLFENAPGTLLEAMASGLPCLGSDTGGISEIIDDGLTGLLFRKNDSSQLLDKIILLVSDKNKRITLGANAREKILQEYDPKIIANKMVEYYSGLLK